VYPRILQPTDREVLHADSHTRDITPLKLPLRFWLHRLAAAPNLLEAEYPHALVTELEAVIRGIAGEIALSQGDPHRAEHLLADALGGAADQPSHQLDELRISLAKALMCQGREDEARGLLSDRARAGDAAPSVLRMLASLLVFSMQERSFSSEIDKNRAVVLLREAATHRADPARQTTLHNLARLLDAGSDPSQANEAEAIADQLLGSSSSYRHAWYIKFMKGGLAYSRSQAALESADADKARRVAAEAAFWYSRAIAARPGFRLSLGLRPPRVTLARFPRSSILHANARDAHARAGNLLRANWHELRFQRLRNKLLQLGRERFQKRNFRGAYVCFDWAIVGRKDGQEVFAQTCLSAALQQGGNHAAAADAWADATQTDAAAALLSRARLIEQDYPLPEGLPGNEPNDPAELYELALEASLAGASRLSQ